MRSFFVALAEAEAGVNDELAAGVGAPFVIGVGACIAGCTP